MKRNYLNMFRYCLDSERLVKNKVMLWVKKVLKFLSFIMS